MFLSYVCKPCKNTEVESCMRSTSVWHSTTWIPVNPVLGEVLNCEGEWDNTKDRHAMASLLNNKRRRYPKIFQLRLAINHKKLRL